MDSIHNPCTFTALFSMVGTYHASAAASLSLLSIAAALAILASSTESGESRAHMPVEARARPSSGPASCPPWWARSQIEREHACEASGAPQVSDRNVEPDRSVRSWADVLQICAHTTVCKRNLEMHAMIFFPDTSRTPWTQIFSTSGHPPRTDFLAGRTKNY